jgi:uncharacterized protein (TIGR00725 family)
VTETRYVAVVGSGTASGELYEKTRVVGRLSGVMEAAARGATEVGGTAIGVLPDEDRRRQNRYLTYSVATGAGQARNLAVVCSGDVVIAVGGEYGTLSEIGLARKVGRPVVVLKGWELGEHVTVAGSPEAAVQAAFRLLDG